MSFARRPRSVCTARRCSALAVILVVIALVLAAASRMLVRKTAERFASQAAVSNLDVPDAGRAQ